jgi:hypothetical protein
MGQLAQLAATNIKLDGPYCSCSPVLFDPACRQLVERVSILRDGRPPWDKPRQIAREILLFGASIIWCMAMSAALLFMLLA